MMVECTALDSPSHETKASLLLDESHEMNNQNNNNPLSSNNASTRRIYQRRNRKGKNSTTATTAVPIALTSTILSSNTTLVINSSAVPINDLFAPISYLTEYKYFFLIGLSLFILLCLISVIFLVVLSRCARIKTWRKNRSDEKRFRKAPDFLADIPGNREEHSTLLDSTNGGMMKNGLIPSDNISNTFSLDPMLEQKIAQNNPPHAVTILPLADDTSLDTLRGSVISSPSQKIPAVQPPPTPTHHPARAPPTPTTTDPIIHPDERAVEAEKEDDLHDLVLNPIPPRFTKVNNNSSSNVSGHRTSSSSIEHTIRRQEKRAEDEERALLHGSNSNLYEKEIRRQANSDGFARNQHTNSQVSLVSRTSEDSCY